MADLKITELPSLAGADLAATDPLAVASLAASDTKKITAKAFTQKAVTLIDDASIPVAKVNLSGISGTNLTDGTVTAAKLNTSTIPATGGLAVSSGNLGLVAPTSPIVRNAGTGSLEHATSGATAGTYTKVTVDAKGHVTAGTSVVAADLPIAVSGTVGVMSPGTGLAVTGGGVLNHSSSITAGTTSGFTYDAQGHITGAVALAGADLPVATSSVIGGTRPGTGLTVDGNGILSLSAATNSVLGGVIVGSDFAVSTGTISLATQGGLSAGQYTKITLNSKGVATAGTVLVAGDIPNLDASKITTGSLDIARVASNTVTGAKLANYAITKIGDTQPTADQIGQFFFNPLSRDLFLWDGNVFQPIGISVGEIVFAGTFDASAGGGTGHVASVTAEGTAIGLVEGSPLPAAATANNRYYLVVSESGTITSGNAPNVALAPPDIVLSTGIEWTEVDVSQTFTSVSASQVAFTPEGTIAANNVQAAIEEVNNEKLGLAGGTITGELLIGTAGTFAFEGSTANAYETYLSAVDPTADRAIVFPDQSGNVIVSGNASIVNADINASAGIAYSKLATLTSGNILVGNGSNVATSVAMSGDVTITNAGVAAIASNVIVDGDISASAEIAVSKLADGTARQLLQTDAAGTGVEWTDNVDVPGTLDVTGAATFDGTVYVGGSLTLEGTTADAFELTFACEPTADRTVTLPDATTTLAGLGVVQSFTVAQRGTVSALGAVSAGTTTLDLATANNFSLSLPAGGAVTLANPSNQTAGQSGVVTITQNSGTAATVAYGGNWKFQGGAPSVSTTLSSVNVIAYYVESSSRITAQLLTNTVS
jgi:hypothetical protein